MWLTADVSVRCPLLHCNERMFVCSWPTLDIKFGYTEPADKYVVGQFLSICIKCWYKTFGDIRRNYSVMKLLTLEQLMNARSGVDVQLYYFFNLGARWGGCLTPRPGRFTSGKDPVPVVQEAEWAPGPVWTGAENLAPCGIRFQDRPAHSQSLYRLSYPGPQLWSSKKR
jgi:hypothetical protein